MQNFPPRKYFYHVYVLLNKFGNEFSVSFGPYCISEQNMVQKLIQHGPKDIRILIINIWKHSIKDVGNNSELTGDGSFAVCGSVMQCVAVCCIVLQYVAVCCIVSIYIHMYLYVYM